MQRRRFLELGIGSAAFLAIAGGTLALIRPGLAEGKLTSEGRSVMRAVARGVLDGTLPAEAAAQTAALDAHLQRVDGAIAAFARATQDELSQLLALLGAAPGRIALAGLASDWSSAGVADVQAALQAMRVSSIGLRMQAYHGLRELTCAAWYADPASWVQLGYPGPHAV